MGPGWQSTPAMGRAVVISAVGTAAAVALGSPVVMVLAAPFLLLAALALFHRPRRGTPVVSARPDVRSLYEGQGTAQRLNVPGGLDGVEHVVRAVEPTPYVVTRPPSGLAEGLVGPQQEPPVVEISPRRWGRRVLGQELVAFTTPWAGYRWGPTELQGFELRVLPQTLAFDSRAQAPRPVGLVGANRSPRLGAGTEFADIRPFRTGDRLRRISWRISARTGELHVTTSPSEQDSGVLLVVDALADHGESGGVDGTASSLDLSVRAAAALAAHHVRVGDRIGLRVVGGDGGRVEYGAGRRHLRAFLDVLSSVRPGELPDGVSSRLQLRVGGGSLVFVLSPMLNPTIGTIAASLVWRGLPVVVIDTLPPEAKPRVPPSTDPRIANLAWRMRLLERDQVLAGLATLGCPVVPWRGPGTVDDVLRRLSRRAPVPTGLDR